MKMEEKMTKFEVGDKIIAKDREDDSLHKFDVSEVGEDDSQESLNKFFIKVDDALWYWEYIDNKGHYIILLVNGELYMTCRSEAIKMTQALGCDPKTLKPIYALGFKLPKQKKDE